MSNYVQNVANLLLGKKPYFQVDEPLARQLMRIINMCHEKMVYQFHNLDYLDCSLFW